jgi:uncharacterized repeat protein (TIGR01451 family)
MKFNRTLKSLFVMASLFCTDPVAFAQVDSDLVSSSIVTEESVVQRPEIPTNMDVRDLPKSARASRRHSQGCYASYLIEKMGDQQSWGDNRLRYQVRVTNLGDCYLQRVSVADFFPEGTRLRRASPRPADTDYSKARWHFSLPVGEAYTIRLQFEVDPRRGSRWVTNNACAWNELVGQRICAWASTWFEPGRE